MPPGTSPTGTSLKSDVIIELRALHDENKIITLNGKKYEVTVQVQNSSGQWDDIDIPEGQLPLIKKVGKAFLKATNNKHFEKAKVVLTGDLIESQTLVLQDKKEVTVKKATVKYKEPGNTEPTTLALEREIERVALSKLDFSRRLVNSKPKSQPPVDEITTSTQTQGIKLKDNHILAIKTDGNCLPSSIAWQAVKNDHPDEDYRTLLTDSNTQKEADNLADYLRCEAKRIIHEKDINDDHFIFSLQEAINEIPEFEHNDLDKKKELIVWINKNKEINKIKNRRDKYKIFNKTQDKIFNDIKRASTKDIDTLNSEERKLLRTFYAEYICQKDDKGKMRNYLGEIFLSVLPMIPIRGKKINCVVLNRDGSSLPTYVKDENKCKILQKEDCVFVAFEYHKEKHYNTIIDEGIKGDIIKRVNEKITADDATDDDSYKDVDEQAQDPTIDRNFQLPIL